MSGTAKCRTCGSVNLIYDPTQGHTSCTECGCVAEENQIVLDPSFQENSSGGATMVGQYVGASGRGFTAAPNGMHNQESRELTISRARQQLVQLGSRLSLKENHVEAATRLYTLALQSNFSRGRRLRLVLAACLYVVCRQEKRPHMLIDFSDVMQTNVFVLGHTYLQLVKRLELTLPILDPTLYIQRFASQLELGDKMHAVATTALRLVGRMKRDWMQFGRRPAGICGASLLIAARLHGFQRSVREIVRVVRICESTIRKRLDEFINTPASKLTFDQLIKLDDDDEKLGQCDPPTFLASQEKKRKDKLKKEQSENSANPGPCEKQESDGIVNETQLDAAFVTETAKLPTSVELQTQFDDLLKDESLRQLHQGDLPAVVDSGQVLGSGDQEQGEQAEAAAIFTDLAKATPPATQKSETEVRNDGQSSAEREPDDFSDVADVDIEGNIVQSAEEVRIKEALWSEMNKDWLTAQKRKEGLSQSAGSVKRKKRKKAAVPTAASAAEAANLALQNKAGSAKIDYEALQSLLDFEPLPTAPKAEPPAPKKEEPVFAKPRAISKDSHSTGVDESGIGVDVFAGVDDDDD